MSLEIRILAAKVMKNAGFTARENNDLPIYTTPSGVNRYPLLKMGKGQHFLVLYRGRTAAQLTDSLTSCIAYARKKTGHKFTLRSLASGVRVWRIE